MGRERADQLHIVLGNNQAFRCRSKPTGRKQVEIRHELEGLGLEELRPYSVRSLSPVV